MASITLINFIAVLILFVGYKMGVRRSLLPVVIVMLIAFFSIRYDYGNDFKQYENVFNFVNRSTLHTVRLKTQGFEAGWYWLNRLLFPLGFQSVIFVTTFIQFASIGWLIGKYVELRYQWIILGIYLFWPALMLTELSMLRQTMAMSIVLFSIPFILNRKFWIAAIIIILSAQFHTSGYVGFLFILIYFIKDWSYRRLYFIFGVLFFLFFINPSGVLNLTLYFLDFEDFNKYKIYLTQQRFDAMRSGMGFIFQTFLCIYLLFILRWRSYSNRFFIISLTLFYVGSPLSANVGNIIRLLNFFALPGILGITALIKKSNKDVMAAAFIAAYVFYLFFTYVYFFFDPIYTRKFMHYTTIFN